MIDINAPPMLWRTFDRMSIRLRVKVLGSGYSKCYTPTDCGGSGCDENSATAALA